MCDLKKLFGAAALGAIMTVASAGEAQAQGTDTTTFNVTITIVESCDIHTGAATNVAFGNQTRSAGTADAAGALQVNCTLNTPYFIGLNNGNNFAATTRRMASGANFVNYGLFKDATRATAWGNTGTDRLSGTGSGSAVSVPVYGRATSLNAPAGNYTDTITATITY
jgi:outer membrane usher protein